MRNGFKSRLAVWAVAALAAGALSCSGERSDLLKCDEDSDCPGDQRCVDGGYCESADSLMGDGGPGDRDPSALLYAAASAEGAPAVVKVTTNEGTCVDEGCTVRVGATVTFEAPEVPGYRFVGWGGYDRCVGTSPVLVLEKLDTDVACVARYVRRYSVRGEVEGGLGQVVALSDAPAALCDGNVCEVDRGGVVVLEAPELEGRRFDRWSGAGCEAADGSRVSVEVTDGDVVCTAHYVPGVVVRGTVQGAEGDVEASSTSPTATCSGAVCQVDVGADVTLSAPSIAGHRFTQWTGENAACLAEEPVLELTSVQEDLTCTAAYVLRVRVSGTASGASPAPSLTALSQDRFAECEGSSCETDQGGAVTLLAPTVNGYRLARWSGDCAEHTGPAVALTGLTRDMNCVAEYVRGVAVTGAAVGAPATVSAASDAPAAVCDGATCVVDVGSSVTLTVTNPVGYRFDGWRGDPECESDELSVVLAKVNASKTCFAHFEPLRFTVNAAAAPQQGGAVESSSSSASSVCNSNGCTVDYGAEVRLRAVPSTGYQFQRWSGCSTSTEPTLQLSNVTSNHTCTANFALIRYTVTAQVTPSGAGSVTTPCGSSACSVDHGSSVNLTAQPAAGYDFSHWSGCTMSTQATLTLPNVTSDQTCTANFVRQRFTVSTAVNPASSGTVGCSVTGCTVDYGGSVTLTATPAAGYVFSSWTGCSTSTQATLTLSNITSHQACTANFERQQFTVSTTVSPAGSGKVGCSVADCTVDYGGSVTLTAEAATGYVFSSWSGCSTSTRATITLSNITNHETCTANFERQRFTVSTTVSPAGSGKVGCSPAGCTVDYGGSVTLTAEAATGYAFSAWSGCSTSTQATLTHNNITSNLACTAHFVPIRLRVRTTVAPAGTGSVTCDPEGCAVDYGGSLTLAAVPAKGYAFSHWSGCSTSTQAKLTLSKITSNQVCTANFAVPKPDLVVASITGLGKPVVVADGTIRVPIRLVVENRGLVAATRFKNHLEYRDAQGNRFVVMFTVRGQSDQWYPWASGLAPSATIAFEGEALFSGKLAGQTVTIYGFADSCASEEPIPAYCYIDEADESNNLSTTSVVVQLQ